MEASTDVNDVSFVLADGRRWMHVDMAENVYWMPDGFAEDLSRKLCAMIKHPRDGTRDGTPLAMAVAVERLGSCRRCIAIGRLITKEDVRKIVESQVRLSIVWVPNETGGQDEFIVCRPSRNQARNQVIEKDKASAFVDGRPAGSNVGRIPGVLVEDLARKLCAMIRHPMDGTSDGKPMRMAVASEKLGSCRRCMALGSPITKHVVREIVESEERLDIAWLPDENGWHEESITCRHSRRQATNSRRHP